MYLCACRSVLSIEKADSVTLTSPLQIFVSVALQGMKWAKTTFVKYELLLSRMFEALTTHSLVQMSETDKVLETCYSYEMP